MEYKHYFFAWLVPGLAHFLKGHRLRGAMLFFIITGLFISGLLMGGGLFSRSGDFLSVISSFGRAGVGLPWLLGLAPGLKFTDMVSGEAGASFATIAGLLNLLAVLACRDMEGK